MIERWFPCAEVTEASAGGWGSGNSETSLFTWFAKRPLAQAKAAVLTSLLPWPDDPKEQRRLQSLVRQSLVGDKALLDGTEGPKPKKVRPAGYDEAHAQVVEELLRHYPDGASLLDPFSGRAMIPLEAAHLGILARGYDYSPVATLAGTLLADYPLRDWSGEPPLPFKPEGEEHLLLGQAEPRLVADVRAFLMEVGRRYEARMAPFYPQYNGRQPWGYLWAVSLPCQECGRYFPLTGALTLRHPNSKRHDEGQSYRIRVDREKGTFWAEVHLGPPTGSPTLVQVTKSSYSSKGKSAVCPFCEHAHPKDVHTRLAAEGLGRDVLLVAADMDDSVGKSFREPTEEDAAAAREAGCALANERPFDGGLPPVPNEAIPPGNTWTVQPTVYGAKNYGDLCNARQTLGLVRLTRTIAEMGHELLAAGCSAGYASALTGYAASVVVRKLKRSTRGATLDSSRLGVGHVFGNSESSISYSYDYFETAIGDGPGTWSSMMGLTLATLRHQTLRKPGVPARIRRGSATSLPLSEGSLDAVVTDPPYDSMIDYSDASDLFYVWLKRALSTTQPDFGFTMDPNGVQEKSEEIIVKKGGSANGDHRTREHYDTLLARSFREAARVVKPDGVVTIVFGHGEFEVWHRLLQAITSAGLYLTGSWPAKTEKGGTAGSANIVTTLTLSCRPAPANRPVGKAKEVEEQVIAEVKRRVPMWESTGLALPDQLMASAGPAMEAVGRYSRVEDHVGEAVDVKRYLLTARRAVEEAAAIKVDSLPLETFDARTRFALFWCRLYGRGVAPKSEARWQAMAADLTMAKLDGILKEDGRATGVRLAFGKEVGHRIDDSSPIIEIALAMAAAWEDSLDAVNDVLGTAGRETDDPHLWAAITYLTGRLPEADPDCMAWTALLRARGTLRPSLPRAEARRRKEREGQPELPF